MVNIISLALTLGLITDQEAERLQLTSPCTCCGAQHPSDLCQAGRTHRAASDEFLDFPA